jgi:hypothetical protein
MEKFKLLNEKITLYLANQLCSNISFLTFEEYTKLITEVSPCPHCIATLLESFAEEIRDNN